LKIIFLIEARQSYRYLSSLIEGALTDRHLVEVWHYCFSVKSIPIYKSPFFDKQINNLKFRAVRGIPDLESQISSCKEVDYFVSLNPVPFQLTKDTYQKINNKWCVIQHGIDSYATAWHWGLFDYDCDLLQKYGRHYFSYTESFHNLCVDWLKKYATPSEPYNYQFYTSSDTTPHEIGCTMGDFDSHDSADLDKIRTKYGVPHNKKICIYLPFPFYPARAKYVRGGSYAWESAFSGIFTSSEDNNPGQKKRLKSYFVNISRRLLYLSKVLCDKEARRWLFNRWNEPSVIKEVKRFCDANDLFLVVKPRKKFLSTKKVSIIADLVIDDDELQYHPSKLQEIFRISSISIGYQSTAVFESILYNVPFINIEMPKSFFNYEDARIEIHSCRDGGIYNYKGVSYNVKIPELLNTLGDDPLAKYEISSRARENYIREYLINNNSAIPAREFLKVLCKHKIESD